MTTEFTYIKIYKKYMLFALAICFSCFNSVAQVKTSVDSTSIKIGQQITYKIEVESDTIDAVVFPEGQTFLPLEMIESFKIDTTKYNAKYNLIKKYGLTQFDSGVYTIPKQKIIVGDNTFYTDSLKVEVKNVVVDTTKQGLYEIKPLIKVQKSSSNWWRTVLIIIGIILLIAGLLYWFIWRKKPLTAEEEIALLPPYDRAKLALQKLDETDYLQNEELKDYYSDLTYIIRKYLDEKVYDKALESTSDELIMRLNLLKDGNQIELSNEDIKNLETIFKRADLVKFAKSTPDVVLAEIDRNTIDLEIDNVKEALPEPTEEEKLLDKQYKEEQERKKKRNKIIATVGVSLFLIIATFIGFGLKYGFGYVKDSIVGHESKELLEGDWVYSEYGVPPIYISTPEVLQRKIVEIPEQLKDKITNTTFAYNSFFNPVSISVSTTKFNLPPEEQEKMNSEDGIADDLLNASEKFLKYFETEGLTDITVKREQFITPNAAEGLKTYGTMNVPVLGTDGFRSANYVLLHFRTENVRQQVVVTWIEDDAYSGSIAERIIDSIELKKEED